MNTALLQLSTDKMNDECEAKVSKARAETRAARNEIKARDNEIKARDEERQTAILTARQAGISEEIIRSMFPKLTDKELQRAFQE